MIAACPDTQTLRPLPELPGSAQVQMVIEFEDGRAIRKTVNIMKGIKDRRAQRRALQEVERVLRHCPGVRLLHAEVLIGPELAGFRTVELVRQPPAIRQN